MEENFANKKSDYKEEILKLKNALKDIHSRYLEVSNKNEEITKMYNKIK